MLKNGDVGDGIAIHRDDVCKFSGLERANAIGLSQEIGGAH
jgi:hypothetical protein